MKSLEYNADLVLHLVKRSFHLRYKGSVIGILWYLLFPLSQLLVLVFLFGKVVPLNIDAYPAFVFCALLPWVWFSSCLNSSASLFIANRDLIRKPNFAPLVLIIVDTLSNLLAYLIFLPVLFLMLALYDHYVSFSLIYFPLLIFIQGLLIIGLGMIISTMNVFYRDIQQIVSVGVMLLFYLTPVFYRSEAISSNFKLLFTLNPIAVLIQSYRSVIFYGSAPEWGPLLFSAAISVVICVFGFLIYKRRFPDIFDAL